MKIVVVSDTHNVFREELPECDILIHCGDATMNGSAAEIDRFNLWFDAQQATYKIFVPGNHDRLFETNEHEARAILTAADYVLVNSGCSIYGKTFWGSPYTHWYGDWAFHYKGVRGGKFWEGLVPEGLDFLVTHGPPHLIRDRNDDGQNCGCPGLAAEVYNKKPLYHVFGHIHEGYGKTVENGITYINASMVDENYKRLNEPFVLQSNDK